MLLNLLAYFTVGVLIDVFYTIWYMGVSSKNIALAMLGSFLCTLSAYSLLYFLVLSPAFFLNLVVYTIGGSVGTGITMWYKEHREVKSKTT
jgi:hypothetical protein